MGKGFTKQSGFVAEYTQSQNKKLAELQARIAELEAEVKRLKEKPKEELIMACGVKMTRQQVVENVLANINEAWKPEYEHHKGLGDRYMAYAREYCEALLP